MQIILNRKKRLGHDDFKSHPVKYHLKKRSARKSLLMEAAVWGHDDLKSYQIKDHRKKEACANHS